jgi:hypothetical protein
MQYNYEPKLFIVNAKKTKAYQNIFIFHVVVLLQREGLRVFCAEVATISLLFFSTLLYSSSLLSFSTLLALLVTTKKSREE